MDPQSKPSALEAPQRPSHHREQGGFRNPWEGNRPTGFGGFLRWMFQRARGLPAHATSFARASVGAHAPSPAPASAEPRLPRAAAGEFHVTAIGHSTFLLQFGPLNVLTDPMFGERASPFTWAGPRRRQAPALSIDALPPIDLVLQSHDHYDHLDLASVRSITRLNPDATWCAPLGVAGRLKSAGVTRIVERDWWESARVGKAEVTCVPAAHFSGRTPFDRDRTLWCGWSIRAGGFSAYFVGDTGMHPAFAAIGERLGPWDAVLMPIGAYAPRWFMHPVHLDPAEAVAAYAALGGAASRAAMIAMHWGTFPLSDEPVGEPPVLTRAAWEARALPPDLLWIPRPGESRTVRTAR